MKSKILFTILFASGFGVVLSQSVQTPSNRIPTSSCVSTFLKCKSFSVSKPLRDLPQAANTGSELMPEKELHLQVGNGADAMPMIYDIQPPSDPIVQREQG